MEFLMTLQIDNLSRRSMGKFATLAGVPANKKRWNECFGSFFAVAVSGNANSGKKTT